MKSLLRAAGNIQLYQTVQELVGQTSLSTLSVSTNKTSTSSVAIEDTWPKDVWEHGHVILFVFI